MVNAYRHYGIAGYVNLEELRRGPMKAAVERVLIEDTAYKDDALVVYLSNDMRVVLNYDRTVALTNLAGSAETDDWIGMEIQLFAGRVKGKDAIRITSPDGEIEPPKEPTKKAKPAGPAKDFDPSDIPF